MNELNDAEIKDLCSWVTIVEIEYVINKSNPDKSPGLDGLNGKFLKENWYLVKKEVIKAVFSFFSSGRMLGEANKTFITLVPKKSCCNSPKDFRPISLCNFIYKVISKIMVNRLRKVLDRIISKNQMAFIHGRNLLDAILLSNDLMGEICKFGNKFMCLKDDITKAYDSLSWSCLLPIMEKMRFPRC